MLHLSVKYDNGFARKIFIDSGYIIYLITLPIGLRDSKHPKSFKYFSFMIPALFDKNAFINLQLYCCSSYKELRICS